MNPDIIRALEIAAIVVAGTLTGSELAVAVFFHPCISRLEDVVHIRAAQTLAKVLGTVMSFWYPLTLLLAVAVTFVAHTARTTSWWLALASTVLFALISRLLRALARSHQQSGCPLAARFSASQLARLAPALGFASCHSSRLSSYRFDSSRCLMCLLNQSPNQKMKLTATAVRFGETVVMINSLPLHFTLCVGGGSLSYSR